MSITKIYYYLFYKYYKFFEAFKTTKWIVDMKAALVVISLEIWILFSLVNYYDILSHQHITFNFFSFEVLAPFLILLTFNWFTFFKNNKWKDYFDEFDQWSGEKNNKGSWVVAGITLFCLANLILSLYLDPPLEGWKN